MRSGLAVASICSACSFHASDAGTDAPATQPDGAHVVDAMLSPDAPPPAIAFVQGSGDVPASSSFTSATFAPQTKGDLNLVLVSWIGTATAHTATDTDGNTCYTLVGSGFTTAGQLDRARILRARHPRRLCGEHGQRPARECEQPGQPRATPPRVQRARDDRPRRRHRMGYRNWHGRRQRLGRDKARPRRDRRRRFPRGRRVSRRSAPGSRRGSTPSATRSSTWS